MPVIVSNLQFVRVSCLIWVILDELLEVRITLRSINVCTLQRQLQIIKNLIVNTQHTRKVAVVAIYGHTRLQPSHWVTIRNSTVCTIFVLINNPRGDDIQLTNNLIATSTSVCTTCIAIVVLNISEVKMGSDAL